MMFVLKLTLSLVVLVLLIECKTLPKYLKVCSLNNSDEFTKCAVEVGNKALKEFIHGDKDYKIFNLDPLVLPSLELDTAGLKLTIAKGTVKGIENVELKSLKYDKKSKKLYMETFLDKLTLDGHYKIDGKIMVLPISGEGHGALEFLDGAYHYTFEFDEAKKNGKEVIKIRKPKLEAEFGGAKFQLDNLFNGNDKLTNEMNVFLNENWQEVVKEFNSLIVEPMAGIVYEIFSSFLDDLPYDEVFVDF